MKERFSAVGALQVIAAETWLTVYRRPLALEYGHDLLAHCREQRRIIFFDGKMNTARNRFFVYPINILAYMAGLFFYVMYILKYGGTWNWPFTHAKQFDP